MDKRVITHSITAILGAFILYWFFWPEFETKTEITETIKTDTTHQYYKEKYRIDSLKFHSLNDSIDHFVKKYTQKLKDKNILIVHDSIFIDKLFEAPLRRFSGQKSFLYGNTYFSSVVAGELIEIDITNDFKIPTVTNTITRKETNTIIKKPRALYLGAGVNNQLTPNLTAHYLDNQFIFSYQYYPTLKAHGIGVAKRLF